MDSIAEGAVTRSSSSRTLQLVRSGQEPIELLQSQITLQSIGRVFLVRSIYYFGTQTLVSCSQACMQLHDQMALPYSYDSDDDSFGPATLLKEEGHRHCQKNASSVFSSFKKLVSRTMVHVNSMLA